MPASPPEPMPALVIGEALVDLIRRPDAPERASVGGSPLNVAVGLSRLDVPVALRTAVGDDDLGGLIQDHLHANAVALVDGSVTRRRTSTAVAAIGDDGSASYDFDITWALDASVDDPVMLVHTGSIAAVLEPGASAVATALRELRSTATISYDPNVRPQLMGDPATALSRIEDHVRAADVVKASNEDLAWLFPHSRADDVARRWLALGPAVVVVTHGDLGAHAVSAKAEARIPAPAVEVVDTIGAGDSFMSGLLAALHDAGLLGRSQESRLRALDADQLRGLLEFAAACAAVTVSRPGADPPRRDRVTPPA